MTPKELEPAVKKAAKKSAKKAAKKGAKKGPKHGKKDHGGKDMRRAYEHLGRLEALQGSLASAIVAQVQTLSELARVSLLRGDSESSANLFRAGEHLAFGSLAGGGKEPVNETLLDAIREQYEKLLERAADHWDENEEEPLDAIASIYEKSLALAETAFGKGAYRKALELARAAEALSHVRIDKAALLEDVATKSAKQKLKA